MKWIKASERLPEIGKMKFMRAKGRGMFIGVNSISDGKIHESSSLHPLGYDYDLIEWLDESEPTPIPASPAKTAEESHVPFQCCPKCEGQGIVSKPSWIPQGVDQWAASDPHHQCDVCNGKKVIPMATTLQFQPCQTGYSSEDMVKTLSVIISLSQPGIPYYAYGDNEAGCLMASILNEISDHCSDMINSLTNKPK